MQRLGNAVGILRIAAPRVARIHEHRPPLRAVADEHRQPAGQILERLVRRAGHGAHVDVLRLERHERQPDVAVIAEREKVRVAAHRCR